MPKRNLQAKKMNTEPTYREAFSSEPDRKPQGFYIDQMKAYGRAKIEEEDSARMKCATFTALDFVCRYITATEGIRKDRVYPGLRLLGYNWCYNEKMSNFGEDIFTQIAELRRTSEVTLNYTSMILSTGTRTIIDGLLNRKLFRVAKPVQKLAIDCADSAGIRTSELNLYHAMYGVKVLVENEPDYILLRENEIVDDAMRVLHRTDQTLVGYKRELELLR
jgi:hypothetical protein